MLIRHNFIHCNNINMMRVLALLSAAVGAREGSRTELFGARKAGHLPSVEDIAFATIHDVPVPFSAFFFGAFDARLAVVVFFEWEPLGTLGHVLDQFVRVRVLTFP